MNGKTMIHGLMLLTWLISIAPGHAQDRWIDPRCTVLPFATVSPLAELRDGGLLRVEGNATRTSKDDGKTWTKPAVIARRPGGGLSYPYVFERRPGELWVITRYSVNLCLKLREADFVGK